MPFIRLLFVMLLPFMGRSQAANRFDVVITEIMADPSPAVALPNGEYIEIKNVSLTPYNLNGWKLGDATSTATITASFILQPDSVVILCATSNASLFSGFGRSIGLAGFPSLDNEGEVVTLLSSQGKVIHALHFSGAWYQNDIKKEGGWSLEMIDTKNPCAGINNWKASTEPAGGTPGKKNAVDAVNRDILPPRLVRTYSVDSVTVMALFDEPADSLSAASPSGYTFSNSIAVSTALPQPPLFNSVLLKLANSMQKGITYTLRVSNVTDCQGNSIGVHNSAGAGIAEEATVHDIVINELLFNPRPNASDYAEILNRGNKIVDAGRLFIASRNVSGLGSIKKLSETPFFIFPGDHLALTEDAVSLQREYLVQRPQNILEISALPSLPDDKGNLVITNAQGSVVDEVSYSENWHFGLISNYEGVALERVDPNDSSQQQGNWHSAASTAGYGTPTYKNSQYKQANTVNATINVLPGVFSPDNDGLDDIATISYQLPEPGCVANVTIFDANGRRIRHLVKNALPGLKGNWNWDGLNENAQRLAVGTYIIVTEVFNLRGDKKQFKNTVVLARKIN